MLIRLIPLFWAFQPFWVEFVCLGPPGVEQTKLCIEPIHVPHVEEVICVADTKVPDQHLLFRQVCEISVTLKIVKVFKPAQAVWVSADTEKVLHAREISNACKYWSLIFQMLPSRLSGYFESNHIQLKFWGMPSSHFDFLNSSHPYCGWLLSAQWPLEVIMVLLVDRGRSIICDDLQILQDGREFCLFFGWLPYYLNLLIGIVCIARQLCRGLFFAFFQIDMNDLPSLAFQSTNMHFAKDLFSWTHSDWYWQAK